MFQTTEIMRKSVLQSNSVITNSLVITVFVTTEFHCNIGMIKLLDPNDKVINMCESGGV